MLYCETTSHIINYLFTYWELCLHAEMNFQRATRMLCRMLHLHFWLHWQPDETKDNNQSLQCTVWVKKNPLPETFWHFFANGWEFLVHILHAYYTFLSTLEYKILFNYLQLWRSYAILSATTIMCSKCPPSTETHAGWSHLIWHNFVIVGDNWIKICTLAYIWTFNRRVKNASMHLGRWWTFCAHDVNWVVTLNMV